jgi:hypothetical protein
MKLQRFHGHHNAVLDLGIEIKHCHKCSIERSGGALLDAAKEQVAN